MGGGSGPYRGIFNLPERQSFFDNTIYYFHIKRIDSNTYKYKTTLSFVFTLPFENYEDGKIPNDGHFHAIIYAGHDTNFILGLLSLISDWRFLQHRYSNVYIFSSCFSFYLQHCNAHNISSEFYENFKSFILQTRKRHRKDIDNIKLTDIHLFLKSVGNDDKISDEHKYLQI